MQIFQSKPYELSDSNWLELKPKTFSAAAHGARGDDDALAFVSSALSPSSGDMLHLPRQNCVKNRLEARSKEKKEERRRGCDGLVYVKRRGPALLWRRRRRRSVLTSAGPGLRRQALSRTPLPSLLNEYIFQIVIPLPPSSRVDSEHAYFAYMLI